jgi:hypothetical protein
LENEIALCQYLDEMDGSVVIGAICRRNWSDVGNLTENYNKAEDGTTFLTNVFANLVSSKDKNGKQVGWRNIPLQELAKVDGITKQDDLLRSLELEKILANSPYDDVKKCSLRKKFQGFKNLGDPAGPAMYERRLIVSEEEAVLQARLQVGGKQDSK